MEIEKTLTVAAPREQVWALLLDPQVMGGAVPGMQSIEVVSPTEYVALMHVKIAFVSAKFKLRTTIVEQRAPEYLRAEGTGEDASVASSLKQGSEVFLEPTSDGGTELRIKVNVDVLGRLGTFGLSVMKTKADRMWDEFGANLKARIEAGGLPEGAAAAAPAVKAAAPAVAVAAAGSTPAAGALGDAAKAKAASSSSVPSMPSVTAPAHAGAASEASRTTSPAGVPAAPRTSVSVATDAPSAMSEVEDGGWWSRLLGGGRAARANGHAAASGRSIRIEVRQLDKTVAVEWPVEAADQCRDWLRELVKQA